MAVPRTHAGKRVSQTRDASWPSRARILRSLTLSFPPCSASNRPVIPVRCRPGRQVRFRVFCELVLSKPLHQEFAREEGEPRSTSSLVIATLRVLLSRLSRATASVRDFLNGTFGANLAIVDDARFLLRRALVG